jgi:hypothetical protein
VDPDLDPGGQRHADSDPDPWTLLVRYRKMFLIFEKLKGFTGDVRHVNKPTLSIF